MMKVFKSQRLDQIFTCLLHELAHDSTPLLQKKWILVPHASLKNWLYLQIALQSRQKVAAGIKIGSLEELGQIGQVYSPSRTEMLCLVYQEIIKSKHSELINYVNGDFKTAFDLARHLVPYFFSYGDFGSEALFHQPGWQTEILRKIFTEKPYRLPFQRQYDSSKLPKTLHCFGFDFLSHSQMKMLEQVSDVNIYIFSPSVHFLEDLSTPFEKRKLSDLWRLRGASVGVRNELSRYLEDAPLPLSNWAKIGREMSKLIGDIETIDAYESTEIPKSLLETIQHEILYCEQPSQNRLNDDSIEIWQTGSSRLNEIEVLHKKIIEIAQREQIQFSEMLVLAPDIQPYVPLIEFVFSRSSTPFKILSVEIGKQSQFYQGMLRLLRLARDDWRVEEIVELLENSSFARRLFWEKSKVSQCIEFVRSLFFSAQTWEKGFEKITRDQLQIKPGPSFEKLKPDSWDEWEEYYLLLRGLQNDLSPLSKESRTLSVWASEWEVICQKYLFLDEEDEADRAFGAHFHRTMQELGGIENRVGKEDYPLIFFESLLKQPVHDQLHSSQLHAVQFGSLEPGSAIPADAIFLIGMDEDSFPRRRSASSLDLLRSEPIFRPDHSDRDRYLFLQILFAAKKKLRMSYSHLSQEDSKPVSASHVVQELCSYIGNIQTSVWLPQTRALTIPSFFKIDPPQEETVLPTCLHLSELNSFLRHPWKHYLKSRSVVIEDRRADSFAKERFPLLQASLKWPIDTILQSTRKEMPGIFEQALRIDLLERSNGWQEKISDWKGQVFSICFLETASEKESIQNAVAEMKPVRIDGVQLLGEIKSVMADGYLHIGEDTLAGLIKVWPDVLTASIALGTSQIFCIKSGKIRTIANPLESLKKLLRYYNRASSGISPLLPDWADSFLRKGVDAFREKSDWEDPVVDWLLPRLEIPPTEILFSQWSWLHEVFSDLTALYPSRKKGDLHAEV